MRGLFNNRMHTTEIDRFGIRILDKGNTRGEFDSCFRWEPLLKITGLEKENTVAPLTIERATETLHRLGQKSVHGSSIAQHMVGGFQLAQDLVGMNTRLSVVGAIFLLARCRAIPFVVQTADFRRCEAKLQLLSGRTAQKHVVYHGFDQVLATSRNRNGDSQIVANLLCLAEQNIAHELIDLAVASPQSDCTYFLTPLAESIDAPLALFQPVWIPRQVIVNDSVEMLLQIDALAKTVGGDENVMRMLSKLSDIFAPDIVGIVAIRPSAHVAS